MCKSFSIYYFHTVGYGIGAALLGRGICYQEVCFGVSKQHTVGTPKDVVTRRNDYICKGTTADDKWFAWDIYNAVRKYYLFKIFAIGKSTYFFNAVGNSISATLVTSGISYQCTHIFGKQHAVNTDIVFIVRWNGYFCKAFAAVKGLFPYVSNAVRYGYLCKVFASAKSRIAYFCHTIWKLRLREWCAVVKSIITYFRHAVRYGYLGKVFAIAKSRIAYFCHTVGNSIGATLVAFGID